MTEQTLAADLDAHRGKLPGLWVYCEQGRYYIGKPLKKDERAQLLRNVQSSLIPLSVLLKHFRPEFRFVSNEAALLLSAPKAMSLQEKSTLFDKLLVDYGVDLMMLANKHPACKIGLKLITLWSLEAALVGIKFLDGAFWTFAALQGDPEDWLTKLFSGLYTALYVGGVNMTAVTPLLTVVKNRLFPECAETRSQTMCGILKENSVLMPAIFAANTLWTNAFRLTADWDGYSGLGPFAVCGFAFSFVYTLGHTFWALGGEKEKSVVQFFRLFGRQALSDAKVNLAIGAAAGFFAFAEAGNPLSSALFTLLGWLCVQASFGFFDVRRGRASTALRQECARYRFFEMLDTADGAEAGDAPCPAGYH